MSHRYILDGQVAVLYSPGFGAGWSTWADQDYRDDLTFDPWIVDVLLNTDYSRKEKLERITAHCAVKYPGQYLGGLADLQVEMVPQGTLFRITEYDGSESVEFKESAGWLMA